MALIYVSYLRKSGHTEGNSFFVSVNRQQTLLLDLFSTCDYVSGAFV